MMTSNAGKSLPTCGTGGCKSAHALPYNAGRRLMASGIHETPACQGDISMACIQTAQGHPGSNVFGVKVQGSAEGIFSGSRLYSTAAKGLPQARVCRLYLNATCSTALVIVVLSSTSGSS